MIKICHHAFGMGARQVDQTINLFEPKGRLVLIIVPNAPYYKSMEANMAVAEKIREPAQITAADPCYSDLP